MADVKKPKPRPPKLSPLTPIPTQPADGDGANSLIAPLETSAYPNYIDRRTSINVGERNVEIDPEDIESVQILGQGAYGIVERVRHRPSGLQMAVKKITALGSASQEQKALLRDMEVLMKAKPCNTIVKFYGALCWDGDLWIFMELMDYSLDKFYKIAYGLVSPVSSETALQKPVQKDPNPQIVGKAITEPVLGKIAASVVHALHYLHKEVRVIHRDVKPSNILINMSGEVKLCDFGISGYLVGSLAKTYDAGCKPYMAPERINPDRTRSGYDIRSDVWSLGITMLELATGKFPYPASGNLFQQLKRVCDDNPPQLPPNVYSPLFEDFINLCLQKDYKNRPYYVQLLEHEFIKTHANNQISEFVSQVISTPSSTDRSSSVSTTDSATTSS